MNLQKNDIKRYILRRYSIDELKSIFNQKLNNQSRNLKHYADISSNKFMNIVVYSITEEILEQLTDGWVEDSPIPEKGLYEFIEELFGKRIIKKYDELTNMNLQETIRRILREETRFQKMGEDKYKSCSMSDITRMEIIDDFFNRVSNDPNYNIDEPDYDMLLDDWGGYDDQVYIQNKLDNDTIIFYEGWVDSCWSAVYNKPQYKGMSKKQVIKDIITNRFPRIAEEFNMSIDDYGYINDDGYIMYVVMKKY